MEKFLIIVYFIIQPTNQQIKQYEIKQEVFNKIKCHEMAKDISLYVKPTQDILIESQCIKYFKK